MAQPDKDHAERIRQRLEASIMEGHKLAKTVGKGMKPYDAYLSVNGVNRQLSDRVQLELTNYYLSRANNRGMGDMEFGHPVTFGRQEAIELVAQAFNAFDPRMADDVRQAAKDGRISFAKAYAPHTNVVHLSDYVPIKAPEPEDIMALPKSQALQAYSVVPLKGDRLSIRDLYDLAHECGHLTTKQAYVKGIGFKKLTSIPMEEAYAILGTELLHDHLKNKYKDDQALRIQDEYLQTKETYQNLVAASLFATSHHVLFTSAEPLTQERPKFYQRQKRKAYDQAQQEFSRNIAEIIDFDTVGESLIGKRPYHALSYPLGFMAARQALGKWKEGDTTMPDRWRETAAQAMGYDEAMTHLGIDLSGPNAVKDALDAFKQQKKTMLKDIVLSRANTIKLGRKLGEHSGEKKDMSMLPYVVQLGAVAETGPQTSRETKR